jgi:Ca2+-binding RTX toxin-like protein
MEGGTGNDALFGGEGDDRLLADAGDDRLDGGGGSDGLEGGEGDDRLQGGAESDTIDGGSGSHDLASWWRDGGPIAVGVVADLSAGTAVRGSDETDLLTAIEDLRGTDASDTLRGDAGANVLLSMSGDDQLFGLEGADTLDGGQGSDLVDGGAGEGDLVSFAEGGPAATVDLAAGLATQGGDTDLLVGIEGAIGSDFNDSLLGDAVANELRGLGGNDLLYGGLGADRLTGGIGRDRFDYDTVAESPAGPGQDVITDFAWNFSTFVDRIDLADIDARSATPADDAFTFIDTSSFTDTGQLRWRSLEEGMVVEANTGGSLAADLEIELAGTFVIDADSFVL